MTPAVVVNNPSNGILEGLWLNPEKDWLRDLQPILSQCIDRSYLNSKLNYGMALPTESIYSVQYDPSSNLYAPDDAAQALEALGWHDEDGNPQTARVAQAVRSVEDGAHLSLSFSILNDPFYEKEAELLQLLLQDCGVHLDILPSSAAVYYQPQDTSIGDDYDMRLVTQRITSDFPCAFQTSQAAAFTFPGISADESITNFCKHTDAGVLPETSISLIPLFYHVDISIARADMCNFTPLGQPVSDLWNIEEFDYGETCSAGIEN
jgi:ABC-type transport system substrate-binding protein